MARHSPVVQAGLRGGFAELTDGVVRYPDTPLPVLHAFVELCATGDALVPRAALPPLFEFCHEQQQEAAFAAVLQVLYPRLAKQDPTAAIPAYLLGDTYCPRIRAAALESLRCHPDPALRHAPAAAVRGLTAAQLREVLAAVGPLADPALVYRTLACWAAGRPREAPMRAADAAATPLGTCVAWDLLPPAAALRIVLQDTVSRVMLVPPDVGRAVL
eukprot:EG_transcript_29828